MSKFEDRGFYTKEELQEILRNSNMIDNIILPVRILITGEKVDVGKITNTIIKSFPNNYLEINAFKHYDDKKGKYDVNRMKVEIRIMR